MSLTGSREHLFNFLAPFGSGTLNEASTINVLHQHIGTSIDVTERAPEHPNGASAPNGAEGLDLSKIELRPQFN